MAEPFPAPSWMTTVWLVWVSSLAPSGVRATRNSLSLTSVGTPTITRLSLRSPARSRSRSRCLEDTRAAVRGGGLPELPGHRDGGVGVAELGLAAPPPAGQ